ncbi:hypothetical protein [Secundilactobacillus folii]|uniref:Uncharacterized protein n=1 Tax=Secundilactobacillus folii TaxID=2678357 RepID=A0A7X3C245_9LACO|nr:hypothetical protein [Secundilactobacillus folii]MTV81092.1 hypothetical protein [Secundilactobacillus folii]
MSNQVSAIRKISSQINDRYRQFLDLDPLDPLQMPDSQLDYFLTQALNRHYNVTLHLNTNSNEDGEDATMAGYLTKGPKDTFLVSVADQKITQLVHTPQIKFIERNDYR